MTADRDPKLPDWFVAAGYKLPRKFPMSLRKDGYTKSFGGSMKWVCGKVPPKQAAARLHERIKAGDFDEKAKAAVVHHDPSGIIVKDLANKFLGWLRQRVETNRPKPLALRTYDDYVIALQLFANTPTAEGRMGELVAVKLKPLHFSAFAARIPGNSPYTTSRYIAYVKAMFSWANENDEIDHPVKFGSDFKKATVEELRAARADVEKEYTKDEVRKLLVTVKDNPTWLAAVLLCCNCAFSNADFGALPDELVDPADPVISFRRGKKGRAFRKCPLMPATVAALDAYRRHRVAFAVDQSLEPTFFRTKNGTPYVRHTKRRDADGVLTGSTRIDSAGMEFAKVLDAAGVHGDGRSLSGFRTTFRTVAEGMPGVEHDAVDLIMGHKSPHISRQYVERFPIEKLHQVVEFVWRQLFDGWFSELPPRPVAADASAPSAEPAPAAAA